GVLADQHGLSAGVLDLRTLVPLDIEAIVAAVEHTGRAVVVSEAPQSAGFAAEVVATICEEAFYSLEAPVARVGGYDVPYPVGMLEEYYVPDAARVVEFALPDVGEGLEEGEIVSWLVGPGDTVVRDQPLVEVQTDKALVELPSPVAGQVVSLRFAAGDIVKVGQELVVLEAAGTLPATSPGSPAVSPPAGPGSPAASPPAGPGSPGGGRPKAAPAVRKLAVDRG